MNHTSDSKTHLDRRLGFLPLFFICVANMIGTGIFTTSGYMARDLGNAWTILICWIVGGVIALAGALCYCELGAMFPRAGGDYAFLKESLGQRAAFLSGWFSLWVGFSAPIAASSMAFSTYFMRALFPEADSVWLSKTFAISVICIFTWLHMHGLSAGVRIQNILTFFKISLILVFVLFGFMWGQGSFEFVRTSQFEPSHFFSQSFGISLIFVTFAYSGWNASAYMGAEVKNPGINLPRSMILSTAAVISIYFLLNLLYLYAAPIETLSGNEEVGHLAAMSLFHPALGIGFSLAISFFLLSTVSSMVITGPRVYYAMAKDNLFFRHLSSVNEKYHVPSKSIVLQAVIASVLVVTSTFESLLIYIGFMLAIFSSLTVVGLIVLRIKKADLDRPYKTWGYPLTPVIFLAMNAGIIWFGLSSSRQALIYGIMTVGLGLLIFEYFNRRNIRETANTGLSENHREVNKISQETI